ncbi:MAG: response regulator [Bacteroidia bacterium]|jgi:CheY-like chemotaxis protein/CRP-like cAMP-binding protein|nr:response regulator [Bacteroidia bacterium]
MKKILLIEDNLDVRENIAEILEMAGYEVSETSNGKEGVIKAKQFNPDLIICDIMMPELDGYGVLNILSADPKTASIPFIFLTAKAEITDIRKGMNMGADDYITKPFEDAELLKAIEVRLGKMNTLKKDYSPSVEGIEDFIQNAQSIDDLINTSKDRKRMVFKKKQPIYSTGNIPRGIYFIEKGSVKTYLTNKDDKDYISHIYGAGEFFGYLSLLEDQSYSDNAEALEETTAYFIPKDDFFDLVTKNRLISQQFLKILTGNIIENHERMLQLAYNSVRKRVAEGLLFLENNYNPNKETPFTFTANRQDLANIVGTATESVIRTLSDFKDEKLIEIKGSHITILNRERLVNMKN